MNVSPQHQTATLGMGCFWSPEALFGHLPGIVRTRVGYAGGSTANPSYGDMGDHSETVEMDFDPERITFEKILQVFWSHHNPLNINDYKGRQYNSLVFYRDGNQEAAIHAVKQRLERERGRLDTEVIPYSAFYMAEDRHQKYYLKRYPDALATLSTLYPSRDDLIRSTLAARLNGLAKGYTSLERIKREIREWPESPWTYDEMVDLIQQIRW